MIDLAAQRRRKRQRLKNGYGKTPEMIARAAELRTAKPKAPITDCCQHCNKDLSGMTKPWVHRTHCERNKRNKAQKAS